MLSEELPLAKNKNELYNMLRTLSGENQDYLKIHVATRDNKPLFDCKGEADRNSIKITSTEDEYTKRIVTAATISGIIHFQVALTNGNTKELPLDESQTTHDARGFTLWFSNVTNNRILIPDTNTIMCRYISSLRFTIGDDLLRSLAINIPRLSVLEMERTANKLQINQTIKKKKRDLLCLRLQELLFLKKNGAIFLLELEKETFEGFSRIANDQVTDSWIRREVHEKIKSEPYLKDSDKVRKVTLFTADLINALSAIAEGIDTMFISRIDYEKKSTRSSNLES